MSGNVAIQNYLYPNLYPNPYYTAQSYNHPFSQMMLSNQSNGIFGNMTIQDLVQASLHIRNLDSERLEIPNLQEQIESFAEMKRSLLTLQNAINSLRNNYTLTNGINPYEQRSAVSVSNDINNAGYYMDVETKPGARIGGLYEVHIDQTYQPGRWYLGINDSKPEAIMDSKSESAEDLMNGVNVNLLLDEIGYEVNNNTTSINWEEFVFNDRNASVDDSGNWNDFKIHCKDNYGNYNTTIDITTDGVTLNGVVNQINTQAKNFHYNITAEVVHCQNGWALRINDPEGMIGNIDNGRDEIAKQKKVHWPGDGNVKFLNTSIYSEAQATVGRVPSTNPKGNDIICPFDPNVIFKLHSPNLDGRSQKVKITHNNDVIIEKIGNFIDAYNDTMLTIKNQMEETPSLERNMVWNKMVREVESIPSKTTSNYKSLFSLGIFKTDINGNKYDPLAKLYHKNGGINFKRTFALLDMDGNILNQKLNENPDFAKNLFTNFISAYGDANTSDVNLQIAYGGLASKISINKFRLLNNGDVDVDGNPLLLLLDDDNNPLLYNNNIEEYSFDNHVSAKLTPNRLIKFGNNPYLPGVSLISHNDFFSTGNFANVELKQGLAGNIFRDINRYISDIDLKIDAIKREIEYKSKNIKTKEEKQAIELKKAQIKAADTFCKIRQAESQMEMIRKMFALDSDN